MKLHFIINEHSGNGKGKGIWKKLKDELKSPYSFHITNYKGHGRELAKRIAYQAERSKEATLIIAIGGDGTIHEVVGGVTGLQEIYFGAVRAGSGNDFSRSFHTFQSAQEIDQAIQGNDLECISYDSGNVEWEKANIQFVNNSGIGFDAFVAASVNSSSAKRVLNKLGLGKLSYAFYVLSSLFTFKLFDVTVDQEGKQKRYQNVWFVTVSNQPYFGGGMKISPSSNANDGLLEVSIVYNLSRLKLLLMFVTVYFGAHTKLKAFEQVQGEKFALYINHEVPCHTDGEILGVTKKNSKLSYTVQKKCWKMLTKNSAAM